MPLITNGQTTTGAGNAFPHTAKYSTIQATVVGTGSVTAAVDIEASNDPVALGWIKMGTISLSGTNSATDGFAVQAPWKYIRGNCTAITGTGAALSIGVES